MNSPRLLKLQELLAKSPTDAFLLYGLAMEYRKAGDPARALEYLNRVIVSDRLYCYAYYQQGQVLESTGDMDAAKLAYRAGLAASAEKGDTHAASEIAGALEMIE